MYFLKKNIKGMYQPLSHKRLCVIEATKTKVVTCEFDTLILQLCCDSFFPFLTNLKF